MTRKDDKIIADLMAQNAKLRRFASSLKRSLRASDNKVRRLEDEKGEPPPPAEGP